MIYAISDIHGCYEEYRELLEKINFSDRDELFVVGDAVDRGPEPMKVLQDMMMRPNVYPILGNHDYIALTILKKLNVEIREDNAETHLTKDDILNYFYWQRDGGKTTVEKFKELDEEERKDILEYLEEFSVYDQVILNGKHYLMAHADIHGFCEEKALENYKLSDFIFYRANYDVRYFSNPNRYLITGHTPTVLLNEDREPKVFEKNGHIAIDCGCVFGFRLAAYCLDNGQVTYVDAKRDYR